MSRSMLFSATGPDCGSPYTLRTERIDTASVCSECRAFMRYLRFPHRLRMCCGQQYRRAMDIVFVGRIEMRSVFFYCAVGSIISERLRERNFSFNIAAVK